MQRRWVIGLLLVHVVLLVAASTSWTVVSWLWGKTAWTFQYFTCRYHNGWGNAYQSPYSLATVLTYIAGHAAGLVAYYQINPRNGGWWRILGKLLCFLGLASFVIEGSHWLFRHHLSLILSCPVASFLLAGLGIAHLQRSKEEAPEDEVPSPAL